MLQSFIEKNHKIANYYGFESQSNMLNEECAELIQAINKYKRASMEDKGKAVNHIIEEIADVEVMIEQIVYLFNVNPKCVEAVKQEKIARTIRRIEEDPSDPPGVSMYAGLYIDRSRT